MGETHPSPLLAIFALFSSTDQIFVNRVDLKKGYILQGYSLSRYQSRHGERILRRSRLLSSCQAQRRLHQPTLTITQQANRREWLRLLPTTINGRDLQFQSRPDAEASAGTTTTTTTTTKLSRIPLFIGHSFACPFRFLSVVRLSRLSPPKHGPPSSRLRVSGRL